MANDGASEGDILDLDVGGTTFRVQRGTLLLAPEDSHLHAMFSGRWEASLSRNAAGTIFIDMSPNIFRVVLSHLRGSKFASTPVTWGDVKAENPAYDFELRAVLQFFGLVDPVPAIAMQPTSWGGIDVANGLSVTRNRRAMTDFSHAPAISAEVTPAGSAWKIRITSLGDNNWTFAGIIGTSAPSWNSYNDATCYGWSGMNRTWVGGSAEVEDGWDGFKRNDVAIFKLEHVLLKMYHTRLQRSFVLELPPEPHWRVHLSLLNDGDQVEVSMPTDQEVGLLS